jgi:integrase
MVATLTLSGYGRVAPHSATSALLPAGTGLRISECLGLQWQDVNFSEAMIHVRRTWTCGQVGLPKAKTSKGPVPLRPLLADFMLHWKQKTTYSQAGDWVFPSTRLAWIIH